jgi:hypothetical protein
MPDPIVPPAPAAPAESVSPNGQLVGLSAQLNRLPPWAMHVVITVTGLAVLVQMMPDGLPPVVVSIASKVVAVGVLLGIASPGARK